MRTSQRWNEQGGTSGESHLDLWDDEWRQRLVVDRRVFSQHVDPLRFRETRDLQGQRTWARAHARTRTQFIRKSTGLFSLHSTDEH